MIDRIRELELRVINAAKKDHSHGCAPEWCGGSSLDPCELSNALEALTFGCDLCNTERHLCPGCGEHLSHGETACLNCAPMVTDLCQCSRTERVYCHSSQCRGGADITDDPKWIMTSFLYIEQGDTLRMGGDVARVAAVSKLDWHADVSDPYRPKAWEHTEIRADVGFGMVNFPPGTPVEVLCDAERKAQLMLSESGLKPRYVNSEEE